MFLWGPWKPDLANCCVRPTSSQACSGWFQHTFLKVQETFKGWLWRGGCVSTSGTTAAPSWARSVLQPQPLVQLTVTVPVSVWSFGNLLPFSLFPCPPGPLCSKSLPASVPGPDSRFCLGRVGPGSDKGNLTDALPFPRFVSEPLQGTTNCTTFPLCT